MAQHETSVDPLLAFDSRADAWEEYLSSPRGCLRLELSLQYLAQHLDEPAHNSRVLDAGGGTGHYTLALAERGYRVCLLDFSPRMLAIAGEKFKGLDVSLQERIDLCLASVEDLSGLFSSQQFDVILCHTVLEYVSEPLDIVRSLTGLLKGGGLISLLLTNPYADAMRFALVRQDMRQARSALEGPPSCDDLFGLSRRSLAVKQVRQTMDEVGVMEVARYGVRVFSDYLPAEKLADPEFFSQLLELERVAGCFDPLKLIARYSQLLGRKV